MLRSERKLASEVIMMSPRTVWRGLAPSLRSSLTAPSYSSCAWSFVKVVEGVITVTVIWASGQETALNHRRIKTDNVPWISSKYYDDLHEFGSIHNPASDV